MLHCVCLVIFLGINGSTNTGLTSNASYQQQSIGQQQRGISNVDGAILGTGGGVVAPPPGFGMPTQQPTYVPQPTNVQSLFQVLDVSNFKAQQLYFQMPTYTHPMSAYPHTPFHIGLFIASSRVYSMSTLQDF